MTPDEYANKWDLAWQKVSEFRPVFSPQEVIAFFKDNLHLTPFDRGRLMSEMARVTCAGKVHMMALWKQMEEENGIFPAVEPEETLRKTVNRAEVNRLQEEILKTVTADTPQEVIDGFLLRTRGYSIMKVEMITLFLAQRKGTTMRDMSERRKELLHSTSPAMAADYAGIEARILLMDEAQNWPTQRDGDTITHGSVTGRATSPLSDRAAVVSSHVDGIDLAFSNWWLDYLRDFDNIPAGAAVDKMKVAFRAGYIRGVKDAKKDGA